MTDLYWLPEFPDRRERIRSLDGRDTRAWNEVIALANSRLDFLLTNALDETVRRIFPSPPGDSTSTPVRLALLGSSTLTQLLGAIRMGGLRRNMWIETYEGDFGQYFQELSDPTSSLHKFQPTAILVALDGYHLAAGVTADLDAARADSALAEIESRITEIWRLARAAFGCPIVQQTAVPVHSPILGNNEHRLPGSRARFLDRLNHDLRFMAEANGVDLLALDTRVAQDGISRWHDHALWHRSKQEISPTAAPFYGDLVARLLAVKQGRSYKCLVLDLDNTLWGGIVGEDGVEGIVLGQGSALGEAYVAFQQYVRELTRRGVILAVCSKNDEANALEAFERHPEMVLKRTDIASFVANWSDKASNIRAIGRELNVGLDSLVLLDDNPFERDLIRRELPMVAVPELVDDPTYFAQEIADAGYFESLSITSEDRVRTTHYIGNREREAMRASATDVTSYLRNLDMRLIWHRFDRVGLQRTVQLINKSNQFNLTTRRYTDDQVLAVMEDPRAVGFQLRLVDRFTDNGVIAIVIGRLQGDRDFYIDTWLMSCRVIGRQVEQSTLNLIAQEARHLGARQLVGHFIPNKKNGMVKDHYTRLGFTIIHTDSGGESYHTLDLESFAPGSAFIELIAE